MLFWRSLFRDQAIVDSARERYGEIARHSRNPAFFRAMGVPDSLDGRFEILCLHAFLVFRHLKGQGREGAALSQAIYDEMFQDLDAGLRELGAADIGVGRRIKAMTEALKGRIQAYEGGLVAGHAELCAVVARNVFGTVAGQPRDIGAIARYLELADRQLGSGTAQRLIAGPITFPDPDALPMEQDGLE